MDIFKLASFRGSHRSLTALSPAPVRPRLVAVGKKYPGRWLSPSAPIMVSDVSELKGEKSYLSSAVESINPWAAKRAPSPAPSTKTGPEEVFWAGPNIAPVDPGDHSTTHLYGQSFHTYPPDCPSLNVQWFHAVDVFHPCPTSSVSSLTII